MIGRAEHEQVERPEGVPVAAGIGAPVVFPEMFGLARTLLDGSLVVTPDRAADALRMLATRAHVVAEGAGAVPVAAALAGMAGTGKIVAIVSGAGIDASELASILSAGPG